MNLPVDLLHWLAAFAPIAMLLFLMINENGESGRQRRWGLRSRFLRVFASTGRIWS